MQFNEFIGIDLAKSTFDCYIYQSEQHKSFSNNAAGFKALTLWLKQHGITKNGAVICMEHTGMYGYPLITYLADLRYNFAVESGLQVKRSLGIQRGKNDKIDAARLAEYAYLFKEKLKLFSMSSLSLLRLKTLLSTRERLVKDRAREKSLLDQHAKFIPGIKRTDIILISSRKMIKQLDQLILKVEQEIQNLLYEDEDLKKHFELTSSIIGVGLITSATLITYTNCFQAFISWRKFASYGGTAPFEYSSGTSIKGKTRVSHYANKKIKTLLTNAAYSAIRHDPQLKAYYRRKKIEGKAEMLVINNVRNKLLARIFAVNKRESQYVLLNHV